MTHKNILTVLTLLVPMALTACSTPATIKLPDKAALEEGRAAAQELIDLPPPRVTVMTGDTLRIVRDAREPAEQDDMSLYVVQPDGLIALPGVGTLQVVGQTPEQIAATVTRHYSKIYREPGVTVNIAISPNNRIFVGGAVPNPAFFDLTSAATLEQALLASGGVLPTAHSKNIALLRSGESGAYNLYFVDLASLLANPQRGMVTLQRGDLIYVPQSRLGATVEAVDMYFTRLFPVNKSIGLGFSYDLRGSSTDVQNSNVLINP